MQGIVKVPGTTINGEAPDRRRSAIRSEKFDVRRFTGAQAPVFWL
jgi:hypothetical protein